MNMTEEAIIGGSMVSGKIKFAKQSKRITVFLIPVRAHIFL
jgi:hypothetical protein